MLKFTDSFDHYTTLTQKWDSAIVGGATPSISATAARNGAKGLLIQSGGDCTVMKALGANYVTLVVGFAMAYAVAGTNTTFCMLLDSSTPQVQIAIDSGGVIRVYRGSATVWPNSQLTGVTLLGTSTLTVPNLSAFHYYEIKVKIDASTGTIEVKVDGVDYINLTGLNTKNTANTYVNQLVLGNDTFGNTAGYWIDDVYVCDTTGSFNNTFLGDIKVSCVMPTANGTTNNFTIGGSSPAATNWQSVNEIPPDDGVTFVADGSVGAIDRYTYPAISGASVLAVIINLRATKDDATTRDIRGAIKSGATLGDTGTDLNVPQTTYADLQGISETDPNTSAAWTVAAVNAAEFGVKVTV